MAGCDIVFDQLVLFGYGLTAIESISMGKIVVGNISSESYSRLFRYYSFLNEYPIVSATPQSVYERLLDIVKNRERYSHLGESSRKYAEKFHSFTTARLMWSRIYRKIWYGEDVETINYFHPVLGEFSNDLDAYLKSSKPPLKAQQ